MLVNVSMGFWVKSKKLSSVFECKGLWANNLFQFSLSNTETENSIYWQTTGKDNNGIQAHFGTIGCTGSACCFEPAKLLWTGNSGMYMEDITWNLKQQVKSKSCMTWKPVLWWLFIKHSSSHPDHSKCFASYKFPFTKHSHSTTG